MMRKSAVAAAGPAAADGASPSRAGPFGAGLDGGAAADADDRWGVPDDGPMVVREKTHVTYPMSLDQALYEMELVGHDFFLFVDAGTARPSVVYRRRAYDYGVIRLQAPDSA